MVLFLKRKNDLEYICSHHSNWENRKTTLQKDKSLIYKTKKHSELAMKNSENSFL